MSLEGPQLRLISKEEELKAMAQSIHSMAEDITLTIEVDQRNLYQVLKNAITLEPF